MKIVVYTCLVGENYDQLIDNFEKPKDIDFVCFTNSTKLKPKNWELRPIKIVDDSYAKEARTARYYKTHPHIFFKQYDISIWIDASATKIDLGLIRTKSDMLLKDKYTDLILRNHPYRNCIYEEMKCCVKWNKDKSSIMRDQIDGYKKDGFPEDFGLCETGILFRKNTEPLNKLNEDWWEEIRTKSIRDQLSFNYIVWKHRFKQKLKMLNDADMEKLISFTPHKQTPLVNIKKKKILLVGPWFGEFGWELFGWQAAIRKFVQDGQEKFDQIIVGTRPGREEIYKDFATDFYIDDPKGAMSGPLLNEKISTFDLQIENDEDVKYLRPGIDFCHAFSLQQDKQKYVKYGKKMKKLEYDILIHIRSSKSSTDFRNWKFEKWKELIEELKKTKLKIACIGSKDQADSFDGVEDLRGTPLKQLVNILASAKILVSPSSGIVHLASLCGCKQLTWTDDKKNLLGKFTNKQRLQEIWNPHNTKSIVIDNEGWNPKVETVLKLIKENVDA